MLKRGCYQGLRDGLKESLRYLYDNPDRTYEDLVEKVIQVNGEKNGRQHALSKSGIIGNEPKISEATGDQETSGLVHELIKVLTAALQAERKKIPSGKGKLPNKRVGAGSAQIASSAGNTQVKGRVDRASAQCNKCSGIGHFARECPSEKYLNSLRGVEQATPLNQGQQGQNPNAPPFVPRTPRVEADCTHTRAGNLATIEKHRPLGGLRGVEEKKKGLEGVHKLEGDQQRRRQMKKKKGVVISKGAQYHNPDAVTQLIGPRNIARVEVNGVEMKALMDSGSQVNMMTEKFLKKTGLILRPLENLGLKLGIEGSAGTDIPYLGYTEANLRLPTANNYSSDQLFLIVEQCTQFGEQVPIQVGTTFQDEILTALPSQDLVGLVDEVKRGIVCRVVLHVTQLTVAEMRKEIDEEIAKTQKEVEWDLGSIKGKVKLTKAVTVPPKGELQVVGVTAVKGYTKRCHVIVEPYGEKQGKYKVTPVYTDLKPGSLRVKVLVTNDSNRPVQLPAKMVIGVISAANMVPAMIAPKNMLAKDWDQSQSQLASHAKLKEEELARRGKLVVEQIDLSSIQNWSQSLQQQVRELLMEFQDIFALNDLELGRTNLVKHHIPLTNPVPFKDRYTRIPPSQFEPLRKLLKNMEEVGAIRKSNSPWSSSIVLVKKKDGNLRFCIDLRKLNARTIKDAYALPRIDETLDYLAGSKWFSALDLKSGYWQVELDEESKPLTAFTAGPLGFYECAKECHLVPLMPQLLSSK